MNTCEVYVPVVIKPIAAFGGIDCSNQFLFGNYPVPPRSTQPVPFDSVNSSFYDECVGDSFDMDEFEFCSEDYEEMYF